MTESSVQKATLLRLPSEIRQLIWEYAFGHTDISLYYNTGIDLHYEPDSPKRIFGSDCSACEECLRTSRIPQSSYEPKGSDRHAANNISQLAWEYAENLEPLISCKMIYSEAIDIFQSTLTLHIKSAEILAFIRSHAPSQLRKRIAKIVVYIHFQDQNEMAWYMRLIELNRILPGLRHVAVNYHMQAPLSYSELADAIFMSMPFFALEPPFNKPLYVIEEHNRSKKCSRHDNGRVVASTDPRPGLTIHTAYKQQDILFTSELLGDVGTNDVIDEHTMVIRTLFEDEDYIAAANTFLASDAYHQPWRRYGPWKMPRTEVPGEIISIRGGRALYDAIEQISHRYEKPWFESLQRKRIVDLFVQMAGLTREEAERRMDRTLAEMGDDDDTLTSLLQITLYGQSD